MLKQARVLIVSCLVSAFPAALALGAFQLPLLELPSQPNWSPRTGASANEVEGTLETSTRATTLSKTSVDSLEGPSQQAASDSVQRLSNLLARTAGRKKARIMLGCHILRRSCMSLCFLLLVSAGFFIATLLKPVAPKAALPAPEEGEGPPSGLPEDKGPLEEEAQPAERLEVLIDPRLEATRKRLVKVKALLPTAARLADAVASPEAQELFKTVQSTVSEGLQAAQPGNDTTELEPSLTTALTALRRLHEAAREKAGRLLLGDRFLHALPELEILESDVAMAASELEGDMVRQTVEPFLRTIRSLQQSAQTLHKRVGNVGAWLHAEREFEDERDEEALRTAAVNLEYLYSTSEARRHSFQVADQVHQCSINAAKALLMAERDDLLWQVNERLKLLLMQTSLEMGNVTRDNASAQQESHDVRAKQIRLEALQKRMDLVILLASQLRAEGRALRSASTLQAAVIHNSRAKKIEERAVCLLEECAAKAEEVCEPAGDLRSSGKGVLAEAGRWLEAVVDAGNKAYSMSLKEAEAQAELLVDKHEAGTGGLKGALILKQKQCVGAIAKNAAKNMKAAASSLASLGRPGKFEEGIKQFKEAARCLRAQILDTMSLRLVNQNCRLMQIMQRDLDYAESEIKRATHRSKHLEGQEKSDYTLLHQRLSEAKRGLKEAVDLGDAAQAAAQVRSRLIALQNFLFASEGLPPIRSLD